MDELRKLLRLRGLETKGTRPVLLKRLRAALDKTASLPPNPTDAVPTVGADRIASPPPVSAHQAVSPSTRDAPVVAPTPPAEPRTESPQRASPSGSPVRTSAPSPLDNSHTRLDDATDRPAIGSGSPTVASSEQQDLNGPSDASEERNKPAEPIDKPDKPHTPDEPDNTAKPDQSDVADASEMAAAVERRQKRFGIPQTKNPDTTVQGQGSTDLVRLRQERFGLPTGGQQSRAGAGKPSGWPDESAAQRRRERFASRARDGGKPVATGAGASGVTEKPGRRKRKHDAAGSGDGEGKSDGAKSGVGAKKDDEQAVRAKAVRLRLDRFSGGSQQQARVTGSSHDGLAADEKERRLKRMRRFQGGEAKA